MLHVRDGLQDSILPLVASHAHYSTFHDRFSRQPTRDATSYCMAPTAIDFYNKIGGMVTQPSHSYSFTCTCIDVHAVESWDRIKP